MNLLLALPTGGQPTAPFLESLRTLTLPPAVTGFERITVIGNFIPGQRELAARHALRLNADVLVMLDDDMVLPADAMVRIVEELHSDSRLAVVGALYYSRDGLHPMAAHHWNSHDTTTAAIPAFGAGLTYCDAVGFGCAAIRVSALRTIKPPYFNVQVYVEEAAARVRICNEDYLFCEAVRQAGWRVALAAGVRCRHYDRATGTSHPQMWEDDRVTAIERMMVAEPGPRYSVVPYDTGRPTVQERHQMATVDYIIVD